MHVYSLRKETETDRETPDIAPIEGDLAALDQLCVETALKNTRYTTLSKQEITRNQ